MTRSRPTARKRGTLHVIGGLLVASALIRVSFTGQAMAEDSPEVQAAMP